MAGPWSRGLERASSGLQVDIEALRFVDEGFRSDHEAGSSKMEGITSPEAPTPWPVEEDAASGGACCCEPSTESPQRPSWLG